MADLDLNGVELIYTYLALTLPFWFPIVMLLAGKSLIFKIKNLKIRLVVFILYTIFCVIFFLTGVRGL